MEELWKRKGPFLLLAGPGTGKTTNLAKRIKYLIENEKVDPDSITIITFTSEAARNMKEYLSDETKDTFLEHDKQPKNIATMHKLGNNIICTNYRLLEG